MAQAKDRPKTLLTQFWSERDWQAHEYGIAEGHPSGSWAYSRRVSRWFKAHPVKESKKKD